MSTPLRCDALRILSNDFAGVYGNGGLPKAVGDFQAPPSVGETAEKFINAIKRRMYGDELGRDGLFQIFENDLGSALKPLDNIWSKVKDIQSLQATLSPFDVQRDYLLEDKKDIQERLKRLEVACTAGEPSEIDIVTAMISLRSLQVHVKGLKDMLDEVVREDAKVPSALNNVDHKFPEKDINNKWSEVYEDWMKLVKKRITLEKDFEDRRTGDVGKYIANEVKQKEWIENITVKYLYQKQRNDHNPYPFKWGDNHEMSVSFTGMLRGMNYNDNPYHDDPAPAEVIENKEKKTQEVKLGTITLPPFNVEYKYPSLLLKGLQYRGDQRSVEKALRTLWTDEERSLSLLRSLREAYNHYTISQGRVLAIHSVLQQLYNDRIVNRLRLLVNELLILIQNLQGNLKAGDSGSMRVDVMEMKSNLAKLDLWTMDFYLLYTGKRPESSCGRMSNDRRSGVGKSTLSSDSGDIICHGTTGFDIGTCGNFRLRTVRQDGKPPYFEHWSDTDFYSAESSWLKIPKAIAEEASIFLGETEPDAFEKKDGEPGLYEARVRWKERLPFDPDGNCWITGYDFERQRQMRVGLKNWYVDREGMTMILVVGDQTKVYFNSFKVSYLVWNPKKRKVYGSGAYCGQNDGKQYSASTSANWYFKFPENMFSSIPAVMLGINSISFDGTRNLRVDVRQEARTKDGVLVTAASYGDTINWGTAVTVIAIA